MEGFILRKLQNKLPQSTDIIAKSKHSSANDFFEEKNFGRGGTGLGRDRLNLEEATGGVGPQLSLIAFVIVARKIALVVRE
jgi:hypothetical protein